MQSYTREGYSSAPPTFTIYDDDSLRAPNIRPPFPPDVTAFDLAELALSKIKHGKQAKPANAFIAYRTVFHRYLKDSGRYLTMPRVSSMSKLAWNEEDDGVKLYYKRLANDAKKIYERLKDDGDAVVMKRSDSSSTIASITNANNNIVDVPTSNNSSDSTPMTTPYISTPSDFTPEINSSSIHHSPLADELLIYPSTEDAMLTCGNIMPSVGEIIRRDELCIHDGGTSNGMRVDEAATQGNNIIGDIMMESSALMESINVPHDMPQDIPQNMVDDMSHGMTHDMAQDMIHNMAHNIAHDMAHDMAREITRMLQSSQDIYQGRPFHLTQQHLQAGHDQPVYLTDDNLQDPVVVALLQKIDHLERVNYMVLRQLAQGYGQQG